MPKVFPAATDKKTVSCVIRATYAGKTDSISVGFTAQTIYTTGRDSKNDQKILVIFGFRAINIGNTRTQPFLKSTQAHFWRKGTKIIDIWDYQQLNSSNESFVAAVTPIMYKKNDLAEIKIVANEDTADANKVDGLEVLGIVVEGLGQNVMG